MAEESCGGFLAFLGKARGYVIAFLIVLGACVTLVAVEKISDTVFQNTVIGCFVGLSAGGGVAAFRKR